MKPSIITCWPSDHYYPLFVKQINEARDLFGKVIVVVTPGSAFGFDFVNDIKSRLKGSLVLTPDILALTAGGKDWRNEAVNVGYSKVDSDYILHLEQDFLADKDFYRDLLTKGKGFDMVGIREESRFHPCCLLVSRKATEKTSKDYGAYPPTSDHFGMFTEEIKKVNNWATLEDLGLKDHFHISGFTHNYRLETAFHRADEFYTYNLLAEKLDQPEEWRDFCREKTKHIIVQGLHPVVKEFFNG